MYRCSIHRKVASAAARNFKATFLFLPLPLSLYLSFRASTQSYARGGGRAKIKRDRRQVGGCEFRPRVTQLARESVNRADKNRSVNDARGRSPPFPPFAHGINGQGRLAASWLATNRAILPRIPLPAAPKALDASIDES